MLKENKKYIIQLLQKIKLRTVQALLNPEGRYPSIEIYLYQLISHQHINFRCSKWNKKEEI